LRQDILKMHRLAEDWVAVRGRVRSFLEQFADGSQRLLDQVFGAAGERQHRPDDSWPIIPNLLVNVH
jgi:hypothetical protein